MFSNILLIFCLSFAACAAITPVARSWAARHGLLDRPDGRRKTHAKPIPVAGGVAVFLSCCISLTFPLLISSEFRTLFVSRVNVFVGLLVAATIVCVVGVVDDYRGLRGRHKLAAQIVAASIIIAFGIVIRGLGLFGRDVDIGVLAIPFTLFWLLGAINSLNLIDGMDGLLSCVGLIVSMALTVVAVINDRWSGAILGVALAGALLGFLIYNFPPASIFLGNSGSMLIGLIVGVMALEGNLKGPATVALAAPIAIMTIPIFDTLVAVLRRKLTGRSIYTTDRAHLHHVLLGRGFSSRRVLFTISFLCLATMCGTLVSVAVKNEVIAVLTALAVVGILLVTKLFGYAEFLLLKNRLTGFTGTLLRFGNPHGSHQSSVQLQGSGDWTELWNGLTAMADELELQSICLDVNAPAIHEGFHARWTNQTELQPSEFTTQWHTEIPLLANGDTVGRLEMVGRREAQAFWQKTAELVQFLERFEASIAALVLTAGSRARVGALVRTEATDGIQPDLYSGAREID